MLHKEFAGPLNVVVIAKTNLKTQARAHVILFTSDLELYSYQDSLPPGESYFKNCYTQLLDAQCQL